MLANIFLQRILQVCKKFLITTGSQLGNMCLKYI